MREAKKMAADAEAVGYPRPALGRRPWFALLRRARRRRRFAFAMGREATRGPVGSQSAPRFRGGDWVSAPCRVAHTHRARLVGMTPASGPFGLVLRSRAVHGMGMSEPVPYVAVDGAGRVVRTGVLRPWRVAWCRAAKWIIELPGGAELPEPGVHLTVDRLGPWPGD